MLKQLTFIIGGVLLLSLCSAQNGQKILNTGKDRLSIRIGDQVYKDAWRISPETRPDVFEWAVATKTLIAFISENDSIGFYTEPGKNYDFIVLVNHKDTAYTRVKATKYTEPAVFTKEYIRTHTGKNFVEIPEVYELVNVLYALTESAEKDNDIVEKGSEYYNKVIARFSPYKKDICVVTIDSLLKANMYFNLKMDAYAFEFDKGNKIVQSKIYDRVGWKASNMLRPYIPLLQEFSDKTNFRKFYKENKQFYTDQEKCYSDTMQISKMQKWLNLNFPRTHYHSFKIIFSPLVSGNQSANWFDNNGFKEAQAHVNFPYTYGNWLKGLSAATAQVKRGNIVFTELNHAYINPEGEQAKYTADVNAAFSDLNKWAEADKPAGSYNNAYQCFNEYMNWGLVSLRYVDFVPLADQDKLIKENEEGMTKYRGFKKFTEFDQYLVKLYRNRKPGATVADLYPQIIGWFKNN